MECAARPASVRTARYTRRWVTSRRMNGRAAWSALLRTPSRRSRPRNGRVFGSDTVGLARSSPASFVFFIPLVPDDGGAGSNPDRWLRRDWIGLASDRCYRVRSVEIQIPTTSWRGGGPWCGSRTKRFAAEPGGGDGGGTEPERGSPVLARESRRGRRAKSIPGLRHDQSVIRRAVAHDQRRC